MEYSIYTYKYHIDDQIIPSWSLIYKEAKRIPKGHMHPKRDACKQKHKLTKRRVEN